MNSRNNGRNSGFTLIEVMIAIAIIGILAAIAVPQYGQYVTKARRADGHNALLEQAQWMERCRTQKYSFENCKMTPPQQQSSEGYYNFYIRSSTRTGNYYEMQAWSTGPQEGDTECRPMTLDSKGVKTPEECW